MTRKRNKKKTFMTAEQIAKLEKQGCRCDDWSRIKISPDADLSKIRRVNFAGDLSIGDNVTLMDIALLEGDSESNCGVGTEVSVLDETGSHAVHIYPALSAQMATLVARCPEWVKDEAEDPFDNHIKQQALTPGIESGAIVRNCGVISNVHIGENAVVEGVQYLSNGSIINNGGSDSKLCKVGFGVNAENFIIEDATVETNVILRNCYVGQGCVLDKGFTAHDSLFFANCAMENGEVCALLAGPYSVSMHKSSLLIGCQTSFMNAGSGTNQSNHMYKLGPKHWGVLERGVKTSSDSYLMFGAKIGAFSLLMGQHKTHPDSSEFPFSYLFGDDRGSTVVVPAAMLRSYGLKRDEEKWKKRDRRIPHLPHPNDKIIYDVLNPLTVGTMLDALDVIRQLLAIPADDDRYLRYKGMKFTRASLDRARHLYELAIYKYLYIHTAEKGFPQKTDSEPVEWIDLSGLLIQKQDLLKIMNCGSVAEMEEGFSKAFMEYESLQRKWIAARFGEGWRKHPEVIANYAHEFDAMVEEDLQKSLDDIAAQENMLTLLGN